MSQERSRKTQLYEGTIKMPTHPPASLQSNRFAPASFLWLEHGSVTDLLPSVPERLQFASPTSERDLAETREQLMTLLRMSPTLTQVIASDPSLLANQDYVNRNNPELEKYLETHPEIVRNPDFYLFADLPPGPGRRSDRLMRKTWNDQFRNQDNTASAELVESRRTVSRDGDAPRNFALADPYPS